MTSKVKTFDFREAMGAFTVTALSSGFGVCLISGSYALASGFSGTAYGDVDAIRTMLMIVSWVFLGLALFVAGIVTVNTFGTIIAGRAQKLALYRLLGASAQDLRGASVRDGSIVGILGALFGGIVGICLTQLVILGGRYWRVFPDQTSSPWFSVSIAVPIVAAALVTVVAARRGSASVLAITPIEAFGNAQSSLETRDANEAREGKKKGIPLFIIGSLLLGGGVVLGLGNPLGVLVAFPGGVCTFIAFMLWGDRIMPPLLGLGASWGHSAPSLLAGRNTVRNPRRATRTAMGIVIGVGMITMFTVVGATYGAIVQQEAGAEEMPQELLLPSLIFLTLVGFSAVLAIIGLLNNSALNAIQRRKEISLLRALGLTKTQVRKMALLEAARTAGVAAAVGLVLGTIYGWAASLSSIGSVLKITGPLLPVVPWQLLVAVILGSLVVALLSAAATMSKLADARPVEALAEG